jgi:hypothetical protein
MKKKRDRRNLTQRGAAINQRIVDGLEGFEGVRE